MLKLFSLALALFSLIVAVQCGGGGHGGIPACPTTSGGPQPSSHNSRSSVCVFKCPQNNVEGNDLSSSIHDSTRLNCRYTTTSTAGIRPACVYNKYTGWLLNSGGHSKCPESALFYCPRTGLADDKKKRNGLSNRSPVPKYFQARTKPGRSNKAKRG